MTQLETNTPVLVEDGVDKSQVSIEATYDNPTKRAWRVKIREAIENSFEKEYLRTARVVCLPGRALQEVTEVYLPLGISPENIICIERDPQVVSAMKAAARVLKLPVNIFEGTVESFLQASHEPVAIASFDFLGQVHSNFYGYLPHLTTAEKCVIITNFMQKRERKEDQINLMGHAHTNQTIRLMPPVSLFQRPSEIEDAANAIRKTYSSDPGRLETERSAIDLSNARDIGMALLLLNALWAGCRLRCFDSLFEEVSIEAPDMSQEEIIDYMEGVPSIITKVIEESIAKYPTILKRLSGIQKINSTGAVVGHSLRGKNGFLMALNFTVPFCSGALFSCNIQRFEYTSEDSRSPYQTDILTQFDPTLALKQKNLLAYNFIREFARVLCQHGEESVTIVLEKFGKELPSTYTGDTVGIKLLLRVKGLAHTRVSLRDLQELALFLPLFLKPHMSDTLANLLDRPRIKIEV